MNKVWIFGTVVIVTGLIMGVSTYKVLSDHNAKILMVEEKYIIEKAKECINQKKCSGDTITLRELYEQKIIDRQVNEVTKEYYNEESYVKIKDSKYEFVIVT